MNKFHEHKCTYVSGGAKTGIIIVQRRVKQSTFYINEIVLFSDDAIVGLSTWDG